MRRTFLLLVALVAAWGAAGCSSATESQPRMQGPPDPRVQGPAPVGGQGGAGKTGSSSVTPNGN